MLRHILTLACPDAPGIVAAVSGFLADHGGFILESQQFGDPATGHFFMRVAVRSDQTTAALTGEFADLAAHFGMEFSVADIDVKPAIVIGVSKSLHCLNDLLHRWSSGALPVTIAAVFSNHGEARRLVEWHGVPFHHLPVTTATRARQELRLLALLGETGSELLVLARYMQVLSPELAARLAWRCINIHHSFLPSFKGARPYHQAHARGVKLIGATAHFVTGDLDEGPIIEQASERVGHDKSAEDLVAIGRDIESLVLARAVKLWAERRVLPNGMKTVVFA